MIVTDGLLGYWNSKQGVDGTVWENIAPATKGQYNGTMNGSLLVTEDGMHFNGTQTTPKNVVFEVPTELQTPTDATLEFRINIPKPWSGEELLYDVKGYLLYLWSDGSMYDCGMFYDAHDDSYGRIVMPSVEGDMFITVTYSYSEPTPYLNFYVNGQLTDSSPYSQLTDYTMFTGTWFGLGSESGTYTPHGIIDNVRVYNKVLTVEEIQQNVAVGREIGLPEPQEPLEVQARLHDNGTLEIQGLLSEGESFSLAPNGDLRVTEIVEDDTVRLDANGKLHTHEFIERG